MADKKISDFTASGSIAANDLFEIENASGDSRKVTADVVKAFTRGHRGALVTIAVDATTQDYDPAAVIPWDTETYDTDAIHDGGNPSFLTVPAGVTKVRLSFSVLLALVTGNVDTFINLRKNGSSSFVGNPFTVADTSGGNPRGSGTSAILAVTAGDDFEVELLTSGDSSISVLATFSWFAMEIIE